jgi:hypothetical protein
MALGDDDFDVYYGDDFAREFVKWSATAERVAFKAIFSVVDEDMLQGFAVSAQYQLMFQTGVIELKRGDVILDGADTYTVRSEPKRVNDGKDSFVLLSRKDATC